MSDNKVTMAETGEIVYEGVKYKQIGYEADVAKFEPQSLVVMNLEMKGTTYLDAPHGEHGVVVSNFHIEDDCYFWLPVVQFASEKRMCNPEYLIIVQRPDGSPYSKEESARLEEMKRKTAEAREKKKKEETGQDQEADS